MSAFKKIIYWLVLSFFTVASVLLILFYLVWNSSSAVDPATLQYYATLKSELRTRGFEDAVIIIGGKRSRVHNTILQAFGASPTSTHLTGGALDVLVMDVNGDGRMNDEDVDIVYGLLHEKIMRGKGGIGTYKNEWGFWNHQTIHFDSREAKARWNR